MSEMLDYALEYAKRGFAVFPLNRNKKPYVTNGFKQATTDEMQIETWWTNWSDANIGIATGQMSGGICVIDLDKDEELGKDGYKSIRDWESLYGKVLKKSWMSITGRGGCHYFFRSSEEVKCRINLLPGVDVRGDGGYIMAPHSLHPNGKTYEWRNGFSMDDMDVIEIDDNIRFLLSHNDNKLQTKPTYISPDKIPQGERNGMMFSFACMLQSKGTSDQAIYAATIAENENKCCPPLDVSEVRQIVKSALKYEKGKPIYARMDMTATQGQREPVFQLNDKGKIIKSWENIKEAIEFDSELYSHIRFNELSNSPWVYGKLPWTNDTYRAWTDADDNNLKAYLEKRYGFSNGAKIMEALSTVLDKNRFNPVKEELTQIYDVYKDDCAGCIRKLLPEYMGAEDNEYNFEVLKLFMLGAICRAFNPGCKFDYTIILYGTQGFGKSEFIRRLAIAPEWFNDNFNTFEGDKASEKLAGMWMVELAELKALKSAKDSETIKAFLTSRYDTYRAPYARRSTQRPRMCVFAGTTNNMNVFVDKTGNRRFLPIVTRKGYEVKSLFENNDEVTLDFQQAWAEAMKMYYEANEKPSLVLPKEINEIAEDMQEEFSEEDYRVGVIQNWLDETNATKICVPQIIEYALNQELSKTSKAHQREILEILDNEIKGWSRIENKYRGRTRCGKYGLQIAFIKDFE